jgi:hypothetical protein
VQLIVRPSVTSNVHKSSFSSIRELTFEMILIIRPIRATELL